MKMVNAATPETLEAAGAGRHRDLQFLFGDERLLARAFRLGGSGTICGMANIAPELIGPAVREGRERIIELVGRLLRAGTRNPEPGVDFDMMAVALVGAGEAVATRVSAGDVDVDEAVELLINLFWRGLKGTPSDRGVVDSA